MPVFTSRIASCSGVASVLAPLASTTRSTLPSLSLSTRPYWPGSSGSIVAIVPAAPLSSCACTRAWIASGVINGTSPERITTVLSASMCSAAALTAPPVPLGSGWTANSTVPGRWSSSLRFGLSTTTTLPAPACCAAATGHRISGRPHSGCRTLGSEERMRVPSPAARMTTVGAGTARIVVSESGGLTLRPALGSGVKAAQRTLTPLVLVRIQAPQSVAGRGRSVRGGCEHVFVPRYTEAELREAVATARSMSEVLRRFGLRPAGGNHKHLRRWLDAWGISTDHFVLEWPGPPRERTPLA